MPARRACSTMLMLGSAVAAASAAHGATIVQYAFPGGRFQPTAVAVNASATDVNATGSGATIEPGNPLANSLFLRQQILSTTPAEAVANNQYFQFTVTPDPGYRFDLASVAFDAARGGGSTPRGFVLRSDRDSFANDISTADIPTTQPTLTAFEIELLGANFQDVASPVTFRIYGYAPSVAVVGSFFDNVTLIGDVEPVPESAAWLLVSQLGVGFLLCRQNRQTRCWS